MPRQQYIKEQAGHVAGIAGEVTGGTLRICFHICSVPFSASGHGSRRQLQAEAALYIAAGQGMLLTPSMIGLCSGSSRSGAAALRAELSF